MIIGLFLVNRDRIRQTLEDTQILTWISLRSSGLEKTIGETLQPENGPKPPAVSLAPEIAIPRPASPVREPSVQTQTPAQPVDKLSAEKPAAQAPETPPPGVNQAAATAAIKSAAAPAKNSSPGSDRERNLYFTQVDSAGTIIRTRVTRNIPASDSPMVDSLKALLAGPNAEEQRRGLMSLIPRGVRILSATVRGSTAYISFSEEFQYNTYGVEGYAAQLRQIIWTATEFPTVKDVQVLIEGRRIDYLGEGIWIGSPLGRDSL
jgi:spore germination protein GerM